MEKLKKENTALSAEKKNFEKKVEKQTCLLRARVKEFSEKYAEASARLDDVEKRYKAAEEKFNRDLKVLTAERDDIASKLKRRGFLLTRCREDNAGL